MENHSIVSSSGEKVNMYMLIRISLDFFMFLQITKEDVDSFETGRGIPSCQLTAVWTKPSKPPALIHKVTLEGAKKPSNYFSIVLDCDSIPPGTPIS